MTPPDGRRPTGPGASAAFSGAAEGQPSTEQVLSRIRERTTVGGPAGAELVRADRDRG